MKPDKTRQDNIIANLVQTKQ